jgi:hypothetical protein
MVDAQREAKQRYDWIGDYREDRVIVELNGKWGFMDLEGNEVVSPIYDLVWGFSNGRARVKLNKKYGIIDLEGKEVIPLIYNYIWEYQDSRCDVKLDNYYGILDMNGNVVLPCWYDSIERLSYGFKATNWVSTHDVEYLHFDRDGHLIAEPVNE